jgi:uncharacterized repeat protein (TIGR03803 family)
MKWYRTSVFCFALVLASLFAAQTALAQTFQVLDTLKGRNFNQGEGPAGFLPDEKGNLIGLAPLGGTTANWGAIFKLDSNGKYSTLHNFAGKPADGAFPLGEMMLNANGNLFGVTGAGGNGPCLYGCGTVFKLSARNVITLLYQFQAGRDGAGPSGGLINDGKGNLYGATQGAGDTRMTDKCFIYGGCGTIFKISMKTGELTTLHRFNWYDGLLPWGGLVSDSMGNIYGVTEEGGALLCKSGFKPAPGCGTVFKLDTAGRLTVLHKFKETDGKFPLDLTIDENGNLFGLTFMGGAADLGEIFELDAKGKFSVLHSFSGTDGELPGGLVATKGKILGTVAAGGDLQKCGTPPGCGTVFEMDVNGGNYKVLHTFEESPDGEAPSIFVTLDKAGNLYGGTGLGGIVGNNNVCGGGGCGTVFKLTP